MHPAATPIAPEPRPSRRRLLALTAPVLVALTGSVVMLNPPPAWGQAAGAAAATRPDDELATAFDRFDQAGPANHAAVDDAAERFARLSAARPADPVLRAYAGASTSMRATTTLLPWRKMTFAEDGLALIDKALAQLARAHDQPLHRGVPAVLETRFVAASTFLGLPSMFNRANAAASSWTRCWPARCWTARRCPSAPWCGCAPPAWPRTTGSRPVPASGTNGWWPATRRRPRPRATG
jgi:hypothetical protein